MSQQKVISVAAWGGVEVAVLRITPNGQAAVIRHLRRDGRPTGGELVVSIADLSRAGGRA